MIVGSCAAPAAGIRPWPTGAWTATPRLSRKSIPWRDSPGAPCCKLDLGLGTIVDDSVTGILKPDPRAYAAAVAALGAQACDVVFVDDLPRNVAGARAFGMVASTSTSSGRASRRGCPRGARPRRGGDPRSRS